MSDRPIERWKFLKATGKGDGTLEIPSLSSGIESGFGAVRFAIGPRGEPRLLVPCGPGGRLSANRSTENLEVTLARLNLAGRPVVFIDLMSVDRSLDPVFAEIANEVLNRIASGAGPIVAVEGTISDFRELLMEKPPQEVEDIKIIGLLGELVVLRKLTLQYSGAVDTWVGPYEQRHDFRRVAHAVEVKTSARTDASSITVTSCEQLSEPTGGSLTLVHVRMERAAEGDLSVAQLVEEILGLGASRASLEKGLSAMGCVDYKSEAWNRMRFGFEGMSGYRVVPGFPRITSAQFPGSELPEGIEFIEYGVDLHFARPFALSDSDFDLALRKVAS